MKPGKKSSGLPAPMKPPVQPPTEQPREVPPGAPVSPSHEQISERARSLWEERGRPEGRDLEHWFEAERALRGDDTGRPRPT